MRNRAALFPIVLAVGVTVVASGQGAQAAPTAITACQTIRQPGSYVLATNLDVPDANGNCLAITVASVTLDLAGFSISGNGPRTQGAGILAIGSGATPFGGIVVRNGSISNFAVGVDLSFAEGSIVEGLRVLNNGLFGIDAHGIVRGNIALDNVTGIIASGTVTGNYATGNNQSGIAITVPSGSSVIGNTATGNQIGIAVNCPANLTDNTATNNIANLVLNGDGCHNEDNVAP
jgi:parallel beta-helix repeat protein